MPLCGQLSKDCLIKWRCFPGTANDSFSFYPNKEINRSANCYPVDFLARMFMAADREAAADRISLSTTAFCHNSEFWNHAINEGQQQDSDEDKDHRTEIVGLAPLVVQHFPGFLKENRNHHLY